MNICRIQWIAEKQKMTKIEIKINIKIYYDSDNYFLFLSFFFKTPTNYYNYINAIKPKNDMIKSYFYNQHVIAK